MTDQSLPLPEPPEEPPPLEINELPVDEDLPDAGPLPADNGGRETVLEPEIVPSPPTAARRPSSPASVGYTRDEDGPGPTLPGSAPTLPGSAVALYTPEAEQAVLGSILISAEALYEVAFLRPEDFYLVKHRWIWDAFIRLNENRQPLDVLTVSRELERHNQLDESGGSAYLAQLIAQVPTSIHAEAYARIVQRDATRRRLIEAASEITKLAYADDRDVEEVVNAAEVAVFAVGERHQTKDFKPIGEVLRDYYDQVEYRLAHRGELFGVPTGFHDLDKVLGGLQRSDLLIIAGRPGTGKTSFMLSLAKNAAQMHRKRVAIFSLEMGNEQLAQRLMSMETGIDAQRLRLGQLQDEEMALFTHATDVLSDLPIYLDDTPALTPLQLRAKCRRIQQEFGLDLILVDYLQLMQGEARMRDNRVQEVSYISRNLKQLARELNVPLLTGAQLSRAVEQRQDKRPLLSDLRESGSLEQDSDIVMFIHRPDPEKEGAKAGVSEIIVAKHRNGPTHGGVELVFLEKLAKFENAARVDLRDY
jgi:replicative DNA helicase